MLKNKRSKVYLSILILLIFLVGGCRRKEPVDQENPGDQPGIENPSEEQEDEVVKEISLKILEFPKVSYYLDEEFDFSGLKVVVCCDNGEEKEIQDYEIKYEEIKIGDNTITIKYKEMETSFVVNVIERKKVDIINHSDYKNVTTKNIDYDNYSFKYNDVVYGKTRQTDMFIVFDEYRLIHTNNYGYEASVDKYGKVVEVGINVSLTKEGIVLSAHGSRKNEVQSISVGDYVLYIDGIIYVYKNHNVSEYNELFIKFYDYLEYLNTIEDVKEYNITANKINQLIPLLENLYQTNNAKDIDLITEYLSFETPFDPYDHICMKTKNQKTFGGIDVDLSELNNIDDYNLVNVYNGTFYSGGFRNEDSIVLYNKDNYRERNTAGYEVGIDKNGIVVSKDVLVNLEPNGYILSGHTKGKDFILENIKVSDKIEIKDNKIYVYRNYLKSTLKKYLSEQINLVADIAVAIVSEAEHDYEYIGVITDKLDEILSKYNYSDKTFYNYNKVYNEVKKIEEYIAIAYSLLIESTPENTRGIWYEPFKKYSLYDDTSYSGVINTLDRLKEMGFNEIILSPFVQGYCLFESDIFHIYPELSKYNYGEYGNDFLKCFIEEAHNRGIIVNAFTQTFAEHISTMKNGSEEFFQMNFQGEKSKGNIYYYDICNDEVQEQLIYWYKELVSKYDFDKVDFDIIRYPDSNLYNYLDVNVISDYIVIKDHGYTPYSMNKFMEKYNLTGDLKELIRKDKIIRNQWQIFKEQELINFITNATNAMKSIKQDLIITAAVMGNKESAKNVYLQDYEKWLKLGIIDEIEPMCYTASTKMLYERIRDLRGLISKYQVRIGISPRIDGCEIYMDLKQIMIASKYKGFVIWSSYSYEDDYIYKILKLGQLEG